jgi:hypothetical protein
MKLYTATDIVAIVFGLRRKFVKDQIDRGIVKIHGKTIIDPFERVDLRKGLIVEMGPETRTYGGLAGTI